MSAEDRTPEAPLIGVDVLRGGELDRLLRRPWFRAYAYAEGELAYARTCGAARATEFLTGRFAAKEAVVKTLGCGFTAGVRPRQVAVLRSTSGAPVVRLSGAAARRAERLGVHDVRVSIAHKPNLFIATALAVRRDHREGEDMAPLAASPSTDCVTASLRLRMRQADAHYGGGLVDGARLLELFGDLVTEITIRTDGDEGLLAEYTGVSFRAPVHPGDYIEATARLVRSTRLRRFVELEAHRIIAAQPDQSPSAARVLPEPELVCRASAVTVVPMPRTRTTPKRHS